jgi:predicted lipoprotein with Yx(FWY)xxD motif
MGALRRRCSAVAIALVVVGCGSAETDGTAGSQDAEATAVEETDATTEQLDLAVADSEFGDILVDGAGMTLYLFTADRDGESVCEDDCADAWPPLVVEGEPVPGEGVDAALLGTTERSDGTTQVTYAGSPLYTWVQDQEPGDVTGQNVQEVWFVVSPAGDAVTSDAQERPARGGGY